jgi:hypothetical protein
MSLQPFFSYFGSKWRLAPRYPRPLHETIIEPFAGSAGYASAAEILRLPLIEPGEKVSDLRCSAEARFLIGFWVNQSSTAPRNQLTMWSPKRRDCFWSRTVRARIASQVDKIRHWQIIEGTYADAPDIEATWFVDPPYEKMGKFYKEGADNIDFAYLSAWCRSRRGQVMVCENEGATWLPFRPFHAARSARPRVGETSEQAISLEAIWTNDAEEEARSQTA